MPEGKNDTTGATKHPLGGRFEIGHPRYGGRKKTNAQQVRDICGEMNVDPMRFMLSLIKEGVTTQVVIENGKRKKVEVSASLETRTDLAKYVSRFIYPTLTATQVSGPDQGPVEVVAVSDITRLMLDPAAVDLAQSLVLKMLAIDPEPAPTAAHIVPMTPKALPAPPSFGPDIDHVLKHHQDSSQRK